MTRTPPIGAVLTAETPRELPMPTYKFQGEPFGSGQSVSSSRPSQAQEPSVPAGDLRSVEPGWLAQSMRRAEIEMAARRLMPDLMAALRNGATEDGLRTLLGRGGEEPVAWLTTGGDVTRSHAYAVAQSVNDPANYPVALYARPPMTSHPEPVDVKAAVERLSAEAQKLRTRKERNEYAPPAWGQDIIDANNALADAIDTALSLIDRLQADNERMVEALKPFARKADEFLRPVDDDADVLIAVKASAIRQARQRLQCSGGEKLGVTTAVPACVPTEQDDQPAAPVEVGP